MSLESSSTVLRFSMAFRLALTGIADKNSKLPKKIQQIFVHFKGLNGKKTAKFVI